MDDRCGCESYLLRTNVGDPKLRESGHLLLVGSCLLDRFPEVLAEFVNEGRRAVLHVCLEEVHMNHAGYKIASIVRYSGINQVTALTIDGSPHCVQLHFLVEDIKRHFIPDVEVRHFVIEKGKVHQITSKAVKRARHLSKIEKNSRTHGE